MRRNCYCWCQVCSIHILHLKKKKRILKSNCSNPQRRIYRSGTCLDIVWRLRYIRVEVWKWSMNQQFVIVTKAPHPSSGTAFQILIYGKVLLLTSPYCPCNCQCSIVLNLFNLARKRGIARLIADSVTIVKMFCQ